MFSCSASIIVIFGSDRSSRNANVRMLICSVQDCLEQSNFIYLGQRAIREQSKHSEGNQRTAREHSEHSESTQRALREKPKHSKYCVLFMFWTCLLLEILLSSSGLSQRELMFQSNANIGFYALFWPGLFDAMWDKSRAAAAECVITQLSLHYNSNVSLINSR